MRNSKRVRGNEPSFKRRKMSKGESQEDSEPGGPFPVIELEKDNMEIVTSELLTAQSVREGMLLLGCVTAVKENSAIVSLPGYLTGTISFNNISDEFTKSYLFGNDSDDSLSESSIKDIIKVGMVFPCKVVEVSKDAFGGKLSITMSIDPQDVNAELMPSSLYPKMVLFVSVSSIEDHGCVVNVGNSLIQGFLPKKFSAYDPNMLRVGAVVPTLVKNIQSYDSVPTKVEVTQLDFNEDYPEVTYEGITLSSLLPGAKIWAYVIEVRHPFVYLKFMDFYACASLLFLSSTQKHIEIGSSITGTVLYVHPITRMIYLMLSSKPTPDNFQSYFGLRKFESVQNLKLQCIHRNRFYYKINRATCGFINKKDLPNKRSASSELLSNISKACVLKFHYMDNLVEMTATKKSLVDQKITFPEDVKIGDIYNEAIVKKHVDRGMLLCICPGLFGFVHRMHMSDVFLTKPTVLFPVGSAKRCRVLSRDKEGKLNLTCKESLVDLPECYVLSSYDIAQRGQRYKGVVVKKADTYILVLFFNNVKGIVPAEHIPKGSVFYEGQVVMCEILYSNPAKKKLELSLETTGWGSVEEVGENVWNNVDSSDKVSPEEPCKTVKGVGSENHKPVKAVIKNVKGSQLNILLGESKGQIHITNLGCETAGIFPLRQFSRGQEINVYVSGDFKKKKYLKITSPDILIKECSLTFPAVSSKCFMPGTSVIGFVKEICDISAVIWLSPTVTGALHCLHYSQRPRVARKLRRYLKVGLSVEVTVLENEKGKGTQDINLTKIEKKLPKVGKNVLGLVQVGCLDRGLILLLPFGYHGVAALTDLTDIYAPVHTLFDKCRSLKIVLCHILEVNHKTKYCEVSLRKSRLYNKITSDSTFCPEILQNNVKDGDTVKGFVKSVSNTALTVVFGRNLIGKVLFHRCSIPGCSDCSAAPKDISTKYPVGSVIQVEVMKLEVGTKVFTLALADHKDLVNPKYNRLSIKEGTSWDESESSDE